MAPTEIEKTTSEDYNLDSFEAVVALFETKREGLIAAALRGQVNLVSFEHGHISFRAGSEAPQDLANRVARLLKEWTGDQWLVSLSEKPGQPTIRSVRETAARERRNEAIAHPLVQAALEAFPGARVEAVTERTPDEEDFENVLLNPDEEEKEI